MDQGQEETSITPELVKERYQKLRDAFLHDETLINTLLLEMESQGKKSQMQAVTEGLLHILEIEEQRTRMFLEWVKLAFDEQTQGLERALKAINEAVKTISRYAPMLQEIETERARFRGSVRNIGT